MSDYHLLICPSNGDGTIDWQSGTGTGGYTLAEHEPGIRTLTKRNPNYWKEGKGHFDEVETLQIADPNARPECPAHRRPCRLHQQRGPEDRRAAEAAAGHSRPIR